MADYAIISDIYELRRALASAKVACYDKPSFQDDASAHDLGKVPVLPFKRMIKAFVSGKNQSPEQTTSEKKESRPKPATKLKTTSHSFADLGLNQQIVKAVSDEGYTHPTPIQAQTIPYALEGRDLLGCAQTGTGKTAAFALPTLQRVMDNVDTDDHHSPVRVLILTPTRELAIQIDESFKTYGKHSGVRHTVIFGGVGQKPQEKAIKRHPHILTATPGRLLDLMNQGLVDLSGLKIFVLDEADRMLDMGFIHDVKRVIKAIPAKRQTLFFSATMPPDIQKLADQILSNPAKVSVNPVSSTAETIEQQVYHVDQGNKRHLLLHLIETNSFSRTLVFSRTKHGANKIADHLTKNGVRSEAIHGNKSQTARQRALENFKSGTTRVLVASDLASRGIDIEEISHVINYDIPNVPETYVHRIGRTGRAGSSGSAISFCDIDEAAFLKDIEKITKQKIPVVQDHPFPAQNSVPTPPAVKEKQKQARRQAFRDGQKNTKNKPRSHGHRRRD